MNICPTPDTLAAYVKGKVGKEKKKEIFKHTGKCMRCCRIVLNLYKVSLKQRRQKNKNKEDV
ncbi:MAG: hypothetical protein ABIA66_03625 [Candidatus Omnitrophota bacterium]